MLCAMPRSAQFAAAMTRVALAALVSALSICVSTCMTVEVPAFGAI